MKNLVAVGWIVVIIFFVNHISTEETDSVLDLFPEINAMRDDIAANRESIENVNNDLTSLTDSYNDQKRAYFTVKLKEEKRYNKGEVIKFNDVHENVPAGAYSKETGIFTVPSDGVYVFAWSINTDWGYCFDSTIKVNSMRLYNSRSDSGQEDGHDLGSVTQMITHRVEQGDSVSITQGNSGCDTLTGFSDANGQVATFMGFKIFDG